MDKWDAYFIALLILPALGTWCNLLKEHTLALVLFGMGFTATVCGMILKAFGV